MTCRRRSLLLVGCLVLSAVSAAAGGPNCFTVVVGHEASASGAVLLAHNEDDLSPQVVNLVKVPHLAHPAGEVIRLRGGGTVPQVAETAAFIWLEMENQTWADCFMNEYGVTIVSNQCESRVRKGELRDGGIGYWLRRLMAERARSSREAVEIASHLLGRFGYTDPGRTYTIADPREAWMLAVTRGRHWVAARIPDDQVAVLPNRYTIGRVDLSDTSRFLASPGLVEFAAARGWFRPGTGEPFDFAAAYASCNPLSGLHSLPRQWFGTTFLAGTTHDLRRSLPFTFRPAHPVALQDLFTLLRSHFEGTQFETPRTYDHGNPHHNVVKRICSDSTQYGMVTELRPGLPPALGCVLWWVPRRPCIQPFVPLYLGAREFPPGYARCSWREISAHHFSEDPERYHPDPDLAHWVFAHRAAVVDADYGRLVAAERSRRDRLEGAALAARERFEARVRPLASKDSERLTDLLTDFSSRWLERLLDLNRTPGEGGEPAGQEFELRAPENPAALTCTGNS